ncbi:coiled-coil domain-containing protein 25 homolog [Octopus sinensis]|uniref:Coiled-coil domain-containing protein 25 n=1 Tax=Octopus sinensis TaxID=2607531 RepID=A0A6P7U984_9MOLL|nr:coiled-coil domain-containing protein 25 homolog [Octopus sinensis]
MAKCVFFELMIRRISAVLRQFYCDYCDVYLTHDSTIEFLEDIPLPLVQDCSQLAKVNSIRGSKLTSTSVVYTKWSNLLKTSKMEAGEVAYHDPSMLCHIDVSRDNQTIRRLYKSRKSVKMTEMIKWSEEKNEERHKLARAAELRRREEEKVKIREARLRSDIELLGSCFISIDRTSP